MKWTRLLCIDRGTSSYHHDPPLRAPDHRRHRLGQRREDGHGGDIQGIFLLLILLPMAAAGVCVVALLQNALKQLIDHCRVDGRRVRVHLKLLPALLLLGLVVDHRRGALHPQRAGGGDGGWDRKSDTCGRQTRIQIVFLIHPLLHNQKVPYKAIQI